MDALDNKNILVVDDDREIVRAIALNLESEGYTVFKAYDGLEALDLAMTKEIHLEKGTWQYNCSGMFKEGGIVRIVGTIK